MLCPSCNTHNRDDAKFCKGCGRTLSSAGSMASANVATAVQETPDASAPEPAMEPAAHTHVGEEVTERADAEGADTEEAQEIDPAQEPTVIISPERMMAYHRRLWQEAVEPQATPAEAEPAHQTTDAPAFPTPAQDEHDAIPIPPPPPPESLATGTETAGTDSIHSTPAGHNNGYLENAGYPEMEMSETMPDTFEQQSEEQSAPADENKQPDAGDVNIQADAQANTEAQGEGSGANNHAPEFAVMQVGATLQGRYEISQVLADNEQEHVYQVIDHQGYQRCWNCNSENNTESDDFCTDCGASLRDIPYLLHEYSSEQNKEDTPVLQGTIVNTFVDGDRTYVIEQTTAEQNAFPNGVHLLAASASDAGNVRRSDPNEDSALILQIQRIHESLSSPVGVYIVADGMGGHDNGQLASRMTINVIAERMTRELLLAPLDGEKEGVAAKAFDEESLVKLLHDSIEDANSALCEVNTRNKTDMGSTLTGFMIVGTHAYIVNVGDSRTYMVRGGQIYQLTTDHSLVGQLVASGLIEPDDVYTHPQRSQIYRSLGDKPNTPIDIFKQNLHPGDKLLSCCDGLWEMVHNPQIESTLNAAPDPQTACQQLIDFANENGGEDNITAVIVYVQ